MARAWKQGLLSNGGPVFAGLAAVVFAALLQFAHVPALDRIGLLLFDGYQRAAPRPYEDAPVRIVDIDDESIRRLGQWPWPRTDIALLTDRLAASGAAVIAYDIVFSEADRTSPPRIAERMVRAGEIGPAVTALRKLPDNDAVLARAFRQAPVLAGYFLLRERGRETVVPKVGFAVVGSAPEQSVTHFGSAIQSLGPLRDSAAGSGFISISGDQDSIVRSAPLIAEQNGQLLPSLALDAVRLAQGAGSITVKTSDGSGETRGMPGQVVSIRVGQFEVPTTASGALWLHYTAPHPQRIIPAWKILSGAMSQKALEGAFAGQIVFVGTGAIGLRDLVSTPLRDHDLGVAVHANAAEQIILGRFLIRPDWATGMERTLLLVLGTLLALLLPRLGAIRGAALGAALVAAMVWGSWHAFAARHYLLDPTYPVLALTFAYVVETGLIFYREERRRSYIHNAFDRYLSPELVSRIAADPGRLELGGEERDMTVMFCDIRGFSRISESMGPKAIIAFLIGFLTPMCDILLARKATIDKFIGDAILAFWNAPLDDANQHENAARSALAMVARLANLNLEKQAQASDPWPGDVKIGIGLNTGLCCVGNMGSAQRLSYSLIGDTVNLASRIESLTKFYGVPIAIGSTLAARLPGFATLELDRVRVVGRDMPETLFALLGDEVLAEGAPFVRLFALHSAMLANYRKQDWATADHALDAIEPLSPEFSLQLLYARYRGRIAELRHAALPHDWDGVYQALEK